ncbi:serine/threonine protein kinase [Exilibacterium tricleocarpae]|uniref:non-specific serine/threonine protein kinase n=1 Tax=Exilibacterium tricleocarpae TaxID=2591008 RepID=A0A545SSN0_9GAMM|nr:serine/threonine-protein kinase [Exilibacterium tricleocarpae]TQV67981.1 serine/threonine protein kinase [Exilibacterium tricleocarpae]
MARLWEFTAAALNLRTLVLAVALGLLLWPWQPLQLGHERALFRLGTTLITPPPLHLGLATLELETDVIHQLVHGPGLSGNSAPPWMGQLLPILANRDTTVGLVLPAAPVWQQDDPLYKAVSATLKAGKQPKLARFFRQRDLLHRRLHGDRVTLGLPQAQCDPTAHAPFAATLPAPLNVSASAQETYFQWLPQGLRPRPPALTAAALNAVPMAPVASCPGLYQPLLWQVEQDTHAGFALAVYSRFADSLEPHWQRYGQLNLDSIGLPLSPSGAMIPLPDLRQPESFSLENFKPDASPEVLLIGESGNAALRQAALSLLALEHRAYFHAPALGFWLHKLLLLALAIYLIWLVPRLSVLVSILLSCLIALVMLVAQIGFQITQWQWLPLTEPLGYLTLGHLAMACWVTQNKRQQRLQASTDQAQYQLALQFYRDGRSEDALGAIATTTTSKTLLDLLYDIGAQFERKRLYSEAMKTYQALEQRQRGFRDVKDKLSKLANLQLMESGSLNGNLGLTKTLVLTDAQMSKPVLGRYEIEKEIGRGAMGVVYLGRDPKIARPVAIKTLNYSQFNSKQLPELKERFFREAEAAGRLSHPNIVTVYDVGEERDLAFIAMDYLQGKPLSDFIHPASLLPVERVYFIMAEVADALQFAHDKKIVHRDVKPANVIYNPKSSQVTVTDFGIARITDNSRTRTGDIMGSPLYMSPEQLRGDKVSRSADIFSLGVTMYQLLTGRLPFQSDNLANLTYRIIHENHKAVREWRSSLPTSATRIINKALQKNPAKRFATAAEMCDIIRKCRRKDFNSKRF